MPFHLNLKSVLRVHLINVRLRLTGIHDCLGPHGLDSVTSPLSLLVLMDCTPAWIVRVMFGFDVAVVDSIVILKIQ